MKKFLDSQIKPKEEREREREERRAEREQERREKFAAKYPNGRAQEDYDEEYSSFGKNQGLRNAPAFGQHRLRIANPAPLGLLAFGFGTFLLALINFGAEGVRETTALTGPFLLYVALMLGISMIFELIAGNTFGATAFGTLAGFFFSFGAILYPTFGTFDTFSTNPLLIFKFLGLFFAVFMIPFGIFVIVTIRATWTLWLQFFFFFIALTLSTAQYLTQNNRALKNASGALFLVTSIVAFINATAGLMSKASTFISPPNLAVPWAYRRDQYDAHHRGHRHEHGHGIENPIHHTGVPVRQHQSSLHSHQDTYGAPRTGLAPAIVGDEGAYRA